MKENKTKIKIHCSPFLTLSSDWESLSLPKYLDLPFEIEWQKTSEKADVVMIPSHINGKSEGLFHQFLKSIPASATLLVYPEPIARVVELIEVTSMQLEHSLWMFPSSVLTPEEIIHQIKLRKAV